MHSQPRKFVITLCFVPKFFRCPNHLHFLCSKLYILYQQWRFFNSKYFKLYSDIGCNLWPSTSVYSNLLIFVQSQTKFWQISFKGKSKVIELSMQGGCNSAPNGIDLKFCMEGTFVHSFILIFAQAKGIWPLKRLILFWPPNRFGF